jgi:putative ABC transport system substrate-binding protein
VEGKNILVEYRSAEGKSDQLARLAAELVHLKVDVIVSSGPTATPAVKEVTSTIPSSWVLIAILLLTGLSPALLDRAETLLDCQLSIPR